MVYDFHPPVRHNLKLHAPSEASGLWNVAEDCSGPPTGTPAPDLSLGLTPEANPVKGYSRKAVEVYIWSCLPRLLSPACPELHRNPGLGAVRCEALARGHPEVTVVRGTLILSSGLDLGPRCRMQITIMPRTQTITLIHSVKKANGAETSGQSSDEESHLSQLSQLGQ